MINNNRTELGQVSEIRATAGDELSLLVNLVRSEQIGVKMLLQNITEILADDASLLVDVVMIITDSQRLRDSDARPEDFHAALSAVSRGVDIGAQSVLISAINEASSKASALALPS